MLRPVYRLLLRLHPSYFRQRFADEMMSIFDQAQNPLAELGLLADAVASLFRQWTLRPDYWAAPVAQQPASNGVPLFQTIEHFKPRKDALLDGMLLTAATFTAICLGFGYTWNHPIFLTLRPIHQGVGAVPKIHAAPPPRVEVPVYTPDGRVVLVFGNPSQSHPDATIPGATVETSPGAAVAVPDNRAAVPETSLASYAGTYSSESGLVLQITQRGANLELATSGQPSSLFAPVSETRFDEIGSAGRWIAFKKEDDVATMLVLHQGNLQVPAYRR